MAVNATNFLEKEKDEQLQVQDNSEAHLGASTHIYKGALHISGEALKCVLCPFLATDWGPIAKVEQGSVGVMTRFGVFERVLKPGLYTYNIMTQSISKVCVMMQTMNIPKQAAMTRDNLPVSVDAVAFVTVIDPGKALFKVDDYKRAVKTLASSTLLRVIAEHDLQQIFGERTKVNDSLTRIMKERTSGWGLELSGVEMCDITIPTSMQRAMAQIAEANREATAKVIVAEGQRSAAAILAESAEIMDRQPRSMQLQWFETLRQIAAEKNSTVIVPDSIIGPISQLARFGRPQEDGHGCSDSNGGHGFSVVPGLPLRP